MTAFVMLLIGYALGYWKPGIGSMTIGKLGIARG
jgi:hypothetical protein